MDFANHVKIERRPDHFFVRFALNSGSDPNEEGTEIVTIVLPLATAIDLSVMIFEAVYKSVPRLQEIFNGVQTRINSLNALQKGGSEGTDK